MADPPAKAVRHFIRWIAAGLLVMALAGCEGSAPPVGGGKRLPDTFAFFDVNANSSDGEPLRRTLGDHLGREAFAGKDVLDLAVFPNLSLDRFFPDLEDLNRQLNPDPRARKEHAITSLTYRYPQTHYPTFTYVRLIFSALHQHPLVIIINANSEAGSIVETLTSKYGPPQVNRLDEDDPVLWSWERAGDQLVVHKHRNKFDRPEFIIAIFYVERIKELLRAEQSQAPGAAAGGKTAF